MKKYIYMLCVMLAAAFTSCNNNDLVSETDGTTRQVILQVTPDQGLNTRATVTGVDRFAIEVYTDADYKIAAKVLSNGTNKASSATGEFAMVLDRTQKYYCLLWADKSGSGVYNIDDLQTVTLTGKAVEAWQGTKVIEAGTEAELKVTLNRAVSKISLMETDKLKAGTLTLNLNQPTVFNVATATTSGSTARAEETITIASNMDGSTAPTTGVKLNTTDIFVLSPVTTANLTDLTFKYGAEEAFIVSQAPLKANFNTNIKGHYSTAKDGVTFTVTCDNAWAGDKEAGIAPPTPPEPVVGDFYLSDGTIVSGSAELTEDQKNKCIGIVFVVNPGSYYDIYQKDGSTPLDVKGYVLALSDAYIDGEDDLCAWASENGEIGTDKYGYTNTQSIISYAEENGKNLETDYPATYHATISYENAHPAPSISSGWFLPSMNECKEWYKSKDLILEKIKKVTGNVNYAWSDRVYWNSSEYFNNPVDFVSTIRFDDGELDPTAKTDVTSPVRPILAF